MEQQKVIFTQHISSELAAIIAAMAPDRLFLLVDDNTLRCCLPRLKGCEPVIDATVIAIRPGDDHKNLSALSDVWQQLLQGGATRHSLLVCLGGGMVTDLGGFAAATFKRGLPFVNIPTTLLSMVDASVGGKTGINFGGLKNEVGLFCNAEAVVVDPQMLATLDRPNLLSGYAEMLKHALLESERLWASLVSDEPEAVVDLDSIRQSVAVKQRIVSEDPTEHGLRKALNLGHTFGHAIEALALTRQPLLHGYAVAFGLVCELYLSTIKTGFPVDRMRQTVSFIQQHYGRPAITCHDYPQLLQLMQHDKKNQAGRINFTLLSNIGEPIINQTATKTEMEEALDFLREG